MLRLFLLAFAMLMTAESAMAAKPGQKPNIILIMADDMGFESVGAYRGQSYATPNMDALAMNGIAFDRAYATPLCSNSRIQLMTGRYQNRNWEAFGILPRSERTIGHYMRDAGYSTLMVGKWQLTSYDGLDYPGAETRRDIGMHPRDAGFDEFSLYHTGHTEDKGSRYADPTIETQNGFLKDTKGKYGPDIWVNTLLDFVDRKSKSDKPFFAYYAMALPHGPFNPTPDSPEWADPATRKMTEDRFYGDMVQYADKLIGRIMATLKERGLDDNTLVLLYSDNGTHPSILSRANGQWLQGGKSYTNELGIRVPLIAHWGGKTPVGTRTNALVDSTDILPTLLDAAGALDKVRSGLKKEGKGGFDGISFLPTLLNRPGPKREWSYLHFETRPGFDKDRYYLQRLAFDGMHKLYEDGRMFRQDGRDIYENVPLMPQDDSPAAQAARQRLQKVLDSMKPYTLFDPASVPRENVAMKLYANSVFLSSLGYVVMEAETVPAERDESWHQENLISGFTGKGYVRALRDQPEKPTKGILQFPYQTLIDGKWSLGIRYRYDHADPTARAGLWVRIDNGPWGLYRTAPGATQKGWQWSLIDAHGEFGSARPMKPGSHLIEIAPHDDNLSIDRLVTYHEMRDGKAVMNDYPESEFNPFVRVEATLEEKGKK